MGVMEPDLKVLTLEEFRKIKYSSLPRPRPKVVFADIQPAWAQDRAVLDVYKSLLKRYEGHPKRLEYARRGSNYDFHLRRRLFSPRGMRILRKIYDEAQRRGVLLVSTKNRPDAYIIAEIIETFERTGRWKPSIQTS